MYRLIYRSRAKATVTADDLGNILDASRRHNREGLIGGALLATGTHFLQVLEGRFDDVNDTFRRIMADDRHEHIELVVFREISERLFSDWSMHGLGLGDLALERQEELRERYGDDHGQVLLPTVEWQALALVNELNLG